MNTDDNAAGLTGAMLPTTGGAPVLLTSEQLLGNLGGNQYTVDWGDDSAIDHGSLPNFFNGPDNYFVTAMSDSGHSVPFDLQIFHSSNAFDSLGPPAQADDIDGITSVVTIEADPSILTAPPAVPNPPPPSLITREEEPLNLIDRQKCIDEATAKARTIADANGDIFVGIANLQTGPKHNFREVLIPLPGGATQTKILYDINTTFKILAIKNVKLGPLGNFAAGGWDSAALIIQNIAQDAGSQINTIDANHLSVTLPDNTVLDCSRDNDFGKISIHRPNENVVEINFGSAYKEVVVVDANKNDVTDIDRLDGPQFDTFVEEKNGAGLLIRPNDLPAALSAWVQEQIIVKANKYFRISSEGVSTRKGPGYVGGEKLPYLPLLKAIRTLRFEINPLSKTVPGFEQAVQTAVDALIASNPGWNISVVYK